MSTRKKRSVQLQLVEGGRVVKVHLRCKEDSENQATIGLVDDGCDGWCRLSGGRCLALPLMTFDAEVYGVLLQLMMMVN